MADFTLRFNAEMQAQIFEYAEEAGLHPAEFIRDLIGHIEPNATVMCGAVSAGPHDWDAEAAALIERED
jgi:hypothetical protein